MRSTPSFVTALVLAIGLAAPTALAADAQGRGQGRGQAAKPDKGDDKGPKGNKADKPAKKADAADRKGPKGAKVDKDVDVVIDRDVHVRVIRQHRGTGALPPGLAKREQLPPGLRAQLVERGELPAGLQRYVVDVPAGWRAGLPPVPDHYRRYFAGDDLIVVDTRTNRIVAIVRDVLR
jgi:hypothetical protein